MAQNKLFRFAEIAKMNNVFEPSFDRILERKTDYQEKWRENIFKNNHPIILELGCGKGEYTVGMAKWKPNTNYIGVDIKGNRIYIGAKQALDEKIENIAFLRARIDFIDAFFGESEVDEIWLTFSDPQPKKPRKRLTSELFINRYRKILRPGGIIHLKTDSDILFEFTEEEIKEKGYEKLFLSWDIYKDMHKLPPEDQQILKIKTFYEKLFASKGAVIKYCKFRIH